MTKRVKLSKWAETAFQNDWELWLTLDLAPEKLGCI